MNPTRFSLSALTAALLTVSTQAQDVAQIDEEILVTADFRQSGLLDLAASASVIDAETIRQRGADHLSQVLNTAPNVNFSAGTSRARFFQIRGIGERSQFVEPVNPSVGLIIDGIDMTGIGAGATTLDIQQVEVLRGPQGTLYGANAMAGLINMVSGTPTESFEGTASLGLAEYNTHTASGVISGPVSDTLSYRLAAGTTLSDGYQENAFLGTDDNADIDEQTLRGKLRWQPRADLTVDLTAFYVDVDNGYDGFSLDNTRTTLSDRCACSGRLPRRLMWRRWSVTPSPISNMATMRTGPTKISVSTSSVFSTATTPLITTCGTTTIPASTCAWYRAMQRMSWAGWSVLTTGTRVRTYAGSTPTWKRISEVPSVPRTPRSTVSWIFPWLSA